MTAARGAGASAPKPPVRRSIQALPSETPSPCEVRSDECEVRSAQRRGIQLRAVDPVSHDAGQLGPLRGGALGDAGAGGYNCGLWILFHTMLANSDHYQAGDTLRAIHTFMKEFSSCEHCSDLFEVRRSSSPHRL
eukprot:1178418-Prorocentrum_minimum.AAC.2